MVELLTDKSSREVSKSYKRPLPLGEGLEKRKKTGAKGSAIISCADPRITPEHFLGLNFGGEFL
jgi:carbonic anhydrase